MQVGNKSCSRAYYEVFARGTARLTFLEQPKNGWQLAAQKFVEPNAAARKKHDGGMQHLKLRWSRVFH